MSDRARRLVWPQGLELKIARIRAGLRQHEVAAGAGIAPKRLSQIETGRRRASPELIERILTAISERSGAPC